MTPEHTKRGQYPLIASLLSEKIMKSGPKDILNRYVDEDLPEFVGVLLEDVNQYGNFGSAPLHVACARGDPDEVTVLLNAGAEVNSKGELGNTPLHCAAGQGYLGIVKLLLSVGADPNLVNDNNDTPEDVAKLMGYSSIVDVLQSAKDAIKSKSNNKNKRDR